MPRAAPTQVIEHRLSLQDAERKAIMEPVGQILTDVQSLTKAAHQTKQVATYGALALGAGAVYGAVVVFPKVWTQTTQLIAGLIPSGLVGDVQEFLDDPVKNSAKGWNQTITRWLTGFRP